MSTSRASLATPTPYADDPRALGVEESRMLDRKILDPAGRHE
jgi:hypothetical protein